MRCGNIRGDFVYPVPGRRALFLRADIPYLLMAERVAGQIRARRRQIGAAQSQAESAGGSRRASQERVRLREGDSPFVHSRKKPGQPRRVHATYRIINTIIVEIAVAAHISGRIGRGKPAHRRVVVAPAEADQAGIGIFQSAGETYGQEEFRKAIVIRIAEAVTPDFFDRPAGYGVVALYCQ